MCPQAAGPQPKRRQRSPSYISPSRGREERGHTIAVNRAASNESTVKNRASGENL